MSVAVTRDFLAKVKQEALGQVVVGSLTPGQALVGVVQRELVAVMSPSPGQQAELNLASQPPAVVPTFLC